MLLRRDLCGEWHGQQWKRLQQLGRQGGQGSACQVLGPAAFQPAGGAINAASLKGKSVWIIVNSLEDPFNAGMAKAAAGALQKAGIRAKVLDGQGSEDTWARLMEEAAAQKPAAVIGSGSAPRS